jgi:hypothetical protein
MRATRPDPVAVFRFALRERDWRLAWLLDRAASDDPAMRRRLAREVRDFRSGRPAPGSLAALGALDAVLEPLDRDTKRD